MSPLYLLWFGWMVSAIAWAIAWSLHGVSKDRPSTNMDYANRTALTLGVILLFELHPGFLERYMRLWVLPENSGWIETLIAYVGFGLSWWAHITLGRKAQRKTVSDGPYQVVRHPMFLGISIAAFSTAAMRGTIDAFLGAILITIGWYLRAQVEEETLRQKLGTAYEAYAAKTAMLVPYLWLRPFSVGRPPHDGGSLP